MNLSSTTLPLSSPAPHPLSRATWHQRLAARAYRTRPRSATPFLSSTARPLRDSTTPCLPRSSPLPRPAFPSAKPRPPRQPCTSEVMEIKIKDSTTPCALHDTFSLPPQCTSPLSPRETGGHCEQAPACQRKRRKTLHGCALPQHSSSPLQHCPASMNASHTSRAAAPCTR